ncbi:transmembrane protein [Thalictrum thalictroides]|uniref:Transmembrane protein n=1 Tax=Thalictrum thalictroides TaxID=46969 RepID=A0A7J6WNB6_THATH|nr:transmembrane protein [Thalictrum thalictroides]
MGYMVPTERHIAVDLESGGITGEDEGNIDPNLGVRQEKKYLGRVSSGIISLDESIKDEHSLRSFNSVSNNSMENGESYTDKSSGGEENVNLLPKKLVKEKRKKGAKKPPKPPRPPGGPSLDAADQKLVREISEFAMLKRARVERLKAQKKNRAAKASSSSSSSSSSSLCALIITLLFCLIIIFQGMFSRSSSHAIFDGSPESSIVTTGPLISVQYYKNPSTGIADPSSASPNSVEQVSGSGSAKERSRGAG